MALRIGTRASALAMTQAGTVADMLGAELVPIVSEGDTSTASLSSLGGTGVFATALREALRRGEVDAVVHSYKDLPTAAEPGLVIAAVPPRADPRDALCARDGMTLEELPPGAAVGTGSPRRRAQLAMRRPDLHLVDIRGNIDTRLGRVGHEDPERALDAVILAAAGLERIGRLDAATELFDLDRWPTAPAQGALAVEVREGDEHLVRRIDHAATRASADAERGVLARLEAGCAAPIAAMAFVEDGLLFLTARVYRPDGGEMIDSSRAMPIDAEAPAKLATLVGVDLIERGAARIAPLDPTVPNAPDAP
ncbi:MAG: hydroxymethylbilane synthase [Microbacterium sp.]|jgi:hydroxymethylbilane synthase|uniref:hydroxymethylbilane synthase n=1 Tax=Microbacterium TaxID=33882 RepID=UPI0008DA7822|nr:MULTISPECIES: hydroxymethylbilane synthase [Microbacterium]MAU48565.1 hydroxymethylbilane synthase [Salipiger sp.]MAY49347.1 hydroxymethylbilane synthase [Microbacterium sp.]|tara:strand:- start:6534 stop:7460 length:927 start_codon:yes stop_codon:yes gene_type:complete